MKDILCSDRLRAHQLDLAVTSDKMPSRILTAGVIPRNSWSVWGDGIMIGLSTSSGTPEGNGRAPKIEYLASVLFAGSGKIEAPFGQRSLSGKGAKIKTYFMFCIVDIVEHKVSHIEVV